MRLVSRLLLAVSLLGGSDHGVAGDTEQHADLPANLRVVLENTKPLRFPRGGRLPLLVLPITGSLSGVDDARAQEVLRQLERRGIGYTVDWSPADRERSLAEGLRIGAIQQRLGLEVGVNANACLHSFFDGSERTLHVDDAGQRFAETSFGGKLGCPFAIEHRYPVIEERVESFLRAYKKAGVRLDFIFADWEIDGPIEWNDAWKSSKRCRRCRKHVPGIDDFRTFQKRLRTIRSEMQRLTFGDNVTGCFPEALVGNYGVYPHDGYRYWYDHFERLPDGAPYRSDQRARYREWFPEFELTGYTFAMPVVYTWYPTFGWYDFDDLDYRWFYNMLRVASNAGRQTPQATPIVPFVHWTTTAPPPEPDPRVRQLSAEKYQELLWHLLLRGHDTFFLWCARGELPREIRLVHQVYAEALEYRGFLDRGAPVTFDVPERPGPVVSGLRLGSRVLVRRTDFGDRDDGDLRLRLPGGGEISVPRTDGCQVLDVRRRADQAGFLQVDGVPRFAIGFYELPENDRDLEAMAAAGVNLVRCGGREDLDRARAAGLLGWVPVAVQQGATEALRAKVASLVDHPALAVWEGPDEMVWTFTAYSGLARSAGFTRQDWNRQSPRAVAYAEEQARKILPAMREGIRLVRELDDRHRPFWINEAADSDLRYVRQYIDSVDVTGCDYYPVRSGAHDLQSIGRLVDRWIAVGRGRPVWMVLQAFSWHTVRPDRGRRYPSFAESRFMAYDAIVHGARGLFYWGSREIDDPAFRSSLHALTAEIAALEPFLVAPERDGVRVEVVDELFDPPGRGVRAALRKHGPDWLLVLVNEDSRRHLGVDVGGLEPLEGRRLELLYGSEAIRVERGAMVTRLQGFEVKVFSTDRGLESPRQAGRDYADRRSVRETRR
ncbi:MAG: hypothetical protein O7J95_19015 [Planctomycetota bacterium]|nr:hypothetical protein [Planctomycetota bacterium]